MAGLKSSSKADEGKSKLAAKIKQGRLNEKISALSAEYVVDSDSDAPADNTKAAAKARNTPRKSEQASSQQSLTKSTSKPAPKSSLLTKRKSPDSNEEPPAANKKVKRSDSSGKQAGGLKASERGSAKTAPTDTRPSHPTHPGKKVAATATNGLAKPNLTANGSSKSKAATKDISKTGTAAVSAPQNGPHNDSSSDGEESEAEQGSTEKLRNRLTGLKSGAVLQKPRKPIENPIISPKGSSQPAKQQDSKARSNSFTSGDNSSEIEESESETGSESESTPIRKKATPKTPLVTKPSVTPILKYRPPPGFSLATNTTPSSSASDLASLFSHSNLASKQIWHFTLPASVPVSAIKSVSMDSILKGASAFTYRDTDYAFVCDAKSKQATTHLLIPNEKGNEYNVAPRSIERTLHLQQVLRLPNLSKTKGKESNNDHSSQATDSVNNNTSSTTTMLPSQKTVHEQPKGLKMRYVPFGDESTNVTDHGLDSDEEGGTELESAGPTGFRMPAGYEATPLRVNGGIHDAASSQVERQESPAKKRKKHRREKEGTSQVPVESQSSTAKSSSQVNGHIKHAPEETVANGVLQKHEGETAEEKAKRRAEKERKKQERRKKRAEKEGASSQVAATQ
ncbi:hypothetical protein MMC18_003698 [Xylographa bjoerkii]|nr:hypothetical protein [Xylographa bjoerkii]